MGSSWGLAGDYDLETSHVNSRASIKGFHRRDAELAPEVLTERGGQLLQAGGQLHRSSPHRSTVSRRNAGHLCPAADGKVRKGLPGLINLEWPEDKSRLKTHSLPEH